MRARAAIVAALAFLAVPACAAPPDLPALAAAEQTASQTADGGLYELPVGAWEAGRLPKLALTGTVIRTAWRLPDGGADTRQLAETLRTALVEQGYGVIFACVTDACGGFDFRYDTALLPEPDMHVDLSDFRYLSAVRGIGPRAEYLGLMISRAGNTGFVELAYISGGAPPPAAQNTTPPVTAPLPEAPASGTDTLAALLDTDGRAVLDGIAFASGSAALEVIAPGELEGLVQYLADNPQARVAIVGHTDASGSLEANIALSRRRAEAVAARLVSEFGTDPAQVEAQGVGYLAPRASNQTEEGRKKNRRVEVMLTSIR